MSYITNQTGEIRWRKYFVGGPGAGIQLWSDQVDSQLMFQEITGHFGTPALHKYVLTKADIENRLLVYNYQPEEIKEWNTE